MQALINSYNITDHVIRHADRKKASPRLFEIYSSMVRHLHDFVREVRLSDTELQAGRDFINRLVRATEVIPDGELHMMTDLLGVSELVELIADEGKGVATERNLLGPLYVPNPPWRAKGEPLGMDANGEALLLTGRVLDPHKRPVAHAVVDVWQAASNGLYDIQDPAQPAGNFRGRYRTDTHGAYEIPTVVPPGYLVPNSGPGGELLRRLGRHPWRAAHIHFKLSAAGFEPLTTQLFIDRDPHLASDTTFAVRSAVLQLQPASSSAPCTAEFDFVLKRQNEYSTAHATQAAQALV
jgi:protocatechuate 3,4-dioxygenase beta subunit